MYRMIRALGLLLSLAAAAPAVAANDRYDLLTRPISGPDEVPAITVLTYHDVRDNIHDAAPQDSAAISTDHLIAHFDWLRANGYNMISQDQLIEAMHGGKPLPDKAVLLSFDDGLVSFYTKVLPLLRAYHYPAAFAIEGSWMDLKPGQTFDYNGAKCGRDCFVSWDQVRQIQASGLVAIDSHTYDLHKGIVANPQGNTMPAAVSLAYDPKTGTYEDETRFRQRIRADLTHSADEIQQQIGQRPKAIVWPYGAYNRAAKEEAEHAGMDLSLSLDAKQPDKIAVGRTIPRLLVGDDVGVTGLATLIYQHREVSPQRVIQVDLDYVYDPDPAQQEKNLSALLDRVKRIKPSQVWLQAYADPNGDGVADAVYFPNRHLPMRADLFSRVSWQLRTRAGVQVYAWLPVLAFRFPDATDLPTLGDRTPVKGGDTFRLAPWDPRVRRYIGDVYTDLAEHAPMAGILFSDDAIVRDSDRLGPWAGTTGAQRTMKMIDFTNELTSKVMEWRTQLKTARNLYARPVLEPQAENWFAQNLVAFLRAYDYVGLMAMPQLDQADDSDRWYRHLAEAVAAQPEGMDRTVFELATVDWRDQKPIAPKIIGERMRLLQAQGVRHLGYYPDDFIRGLPGREAIRPYISVADYPYLSH